MKKFVIIIAATILCGIAYGQESQRLRLEKHLYTLAADSLQGRKAGTDDARKAARYITGQWNGMGLSGKWSPLPFGIGTRDGFCDYYFVIEGNDPLMKDEYIVVGAHYDHIGVKKSKVYNGADDNASGSSCVIEVARQLLAKKGQLKRSVIICAYDAEEMGLFGSTEHVNYLKEKNMIDKVKLMMSIDMVGWYSTNGALELDGVGTLADGEALIDPHALGVDIKVSTKKYESSVFTATDTEPYAKEGIPTLAVSTGLKSPYHKPEDDANLIDYEGLDRVTDYVAALTIAAANRPGNLASGKLAAKHRGTANTFNFGFNLGFNSSYVDFPDAPFIGKSAIGFLGGLTMQYNFKDYFGIRADVAYAYTHSPYPDVTDAFGKGYGIEQHSILVPVMFQLHTKDPANGVYFNIGGFYGRVLDGCFYSQTGGPAYEIQKNQFGIAFGFGFRLAYHWILDFTSYSQLNQLFDTANGLPKAKKQIVSFSLGYNF